jgi:hypothetical protein
MYYNISESYNTSIVGSYPQLYLVREDYNNLANSLGEYQWGFKIPDDNLLIPEVKFYSGVKKTDVLSSAFLIFGLIINAKVKHILENYKLGDNFRFYELQDNFIGEEYHLLYVQNNFLEYVDFKKTHFSFRVGSDLTKNRIEIDNSAQYIKIKEEFLTTGKRLMMGKVVLVDTFPKYDLFWFTKSSNEKYVSEKLRLDLEENRITGLDFSEADLEIKIK